MTREAGWRYGIISTVMVGVMVSYLRLWLALWYHIYGYGIISTVMVGVMVSYLRLWLALWYHIYGYGWRYGIISTVPYEQQKIYRQIILFQIIIFFHQFNRPPVSSWTVNCFDVYVSRNKNHLYKILTIFSPLQDGVYSCSRRTCPQLSCAHKIHPPDSCCEQCRRRRKGKASKRKKGGKRSRKRKMRKNRTTDGGRRG